MLNVISYFKKRRQAWHDYYHLQRMPDRLLEDIGIERRELSQVRRGRAIR
jgi:uncharacterized protein YjiS (DUF1127 family)